MAADFDATSQGSWSSGLTTTVSHTCSASATHLLVAVSYKFHNTTLITGVTYNGVAMTHVTTDSIDGSDLYCISWWSLASPTTGSAQNIVVTIDDNTDVVLRVKGISVTGGASVSATQTNTAASGNPTI